MQSNQLDINGSHVWFLGEVLTAYIEESYDRSQSISYWGNQYRKTGEELAVMQIKGDKAVGLIKTK